MYICGNDWCIIYVISLSSSFDFTVIDLNNVPILRFSVAVFSAGTQFLTDAIAKIVLQIPIFIGFSHTFTRTNCKPIG